MISLPARLIVRSYLVRSARLWVVARGLLVLQLLYAGQAPFGFPSSVTAVAVTAALGLAETHRRREWALLGNLGVGMRELIPLLLVPPAIGETVLQIVKAMAT